MQTNKNYLFLVTLITVSLLIRLYRFNPEVGFLTSDDPYVALASLDIFNIDGSISSILIHLLRLLSFGWGYLRLLTITTPIFLFSIFESKINEFVIVFSQIIIGVITCIVVYYLSLEVFNNKVAKLSSLIVSILPLAVTASRTIYNTSNTSTLLLLLFILSFIKYIKYNKCKISTPILLGIYFSADNQFIAIIPVIIYLIYIYKKRISLQEITRFLSISFITYLPSLIPFLYFYLIRGKIDGGIIAHNLSKSKGLNFNYELVLQMIHSQGLFLFILTSIAFVYGVYYIFKRKKYSFITVWSLIYLLPWFFFITYMNASRPYILPGIIPLIILTSYIIFIIRSKFIKWVIIILLLLTTLNYTLYNVHKLELFKPLILDSGIILPNYFYGNYITQNIDVKTAGYWIRHNAPINSRIFTTIGVPLAKYYFHRRIIDDEKNFYSIASGNNTEKLNFFKQVQDNIDFVVLPYQHINLFSNMLKDFENVVIIGEDNFTLYIYSRENYQFQNLTGKQYIDLFDNEYGDINSLKVDCYFCNDLTR